VRNVSKNYYFFKNLFFFKGLAAADVRCKAETKRHKNVSKERERLLVYVSCV
jgi:hypothetical protein